MFKRLFRSAIASFEHEEMIKKIYVTHSKKDLKGKPATQDHCSNLIKGEADIFDEATGKLVVSTRYIKETKQLTPFLRRIKYNKDSRTSGLPTISKVFGYYPRIKIRNDFCTEGILALHDPKANNALYAMAQLLEKFYAKLNPELYKSHLKMVQNILPQWRIRGGGIYFWDSKQKQPIALPQRRREFQRDLGSDVECE